MKADKQTPEILDYVFSCFKEKFADEIMGGGVKFLPHEVLVHIKIRQKNDEILRLARMIESEFDELGRSVSILIK